MTNLEEYRDQRKILIRLRDYHLARYEAARDKRKVQSDMKKAEALTTAIRVLENEIASLKAIQSRWLDRVIDGSH